MIYFISKSLYYYHTIICYYTDRIMSIISKWSVNYMCYLTIISLLSHYYLTIILPIILPIIRYYTFAPYYTLLSFLLSHYYLLLSHYYTLLFHYYLPIILPIIRYYTFPHYYTLLSLLLYAIIRNANYYFNYLIFFTANYSCLFFEN